VTQPGDVLARGNRRVIVASLTEDGTRAWVTERLWYGMVATNPAYLVELADWEVVPVGTLELTPYRPQPRKKRK